MANPRGCYVKGWDAVFSTHCEIKEDWSCSFADQKTELGAAGYGIELFLQDSEGSDLDDKVEELKEFTASVSLEDLKAASGSAGPRRGAWLDDRTDPNRYKTSRAREHKNPLTAAQLCERLQTPVCKISRFLP